MLALILKQVEVPCRIAVHKDQVCVCARFDNAKFSCLPQYISANQCGLANDFQGAQDFGAQQKFARLF